MHVPRKLSLHFFYCLVTAVALFPQFIESGAVIKQFTRRAYPELSESGVYSDNSTETPNSKLNSLGRVEGSDYHAEARTLLKRDDSPRSEELRRRLSKAKKRYNRISSPGYIAALDSKEFASAVIDYHESMFEYYSLLLDGKRAPQESDYLYDSEFFESTHKLEPGKNLAACTKRHCGDESCFTTITNAMKLMKSKFKELKLDPKPDKPKHLKKYTLLDLFLKRFLASSSTTLGRVIERGNGRASGFQPTDSLTKRVKWILERARNFESKTSAAVTNLNPSERSVLEPIKFPQSITLRTDDEGNNYKYMFGDFGMAVFCLDFENHHMKEIGGFEPVKENRPGPPAQEVTGTLNPYYYKSAEVGHACCYTVGYPSQLKY